VARRDTLRNSRGLTPEWFRIKVHEMRGLRKAQFRADIA
jgi:hypothetical protein